ncbi:MAG: hypothetical protein KF901_28280 [Myxococcales bacterium]|nr:hypothetical protein [Myxococcales bacterium]
MLHVIVQTPCVQVYELANHLADSVTQDILRLPIRDAAARRALLEHDPAVGQVVGFEVRLVDGTVALRGKGRARSAILGERGVELEISSYYLEGPGAPLFWDLARQQHTSRASSPSIPPIWGDETVPEDGRPGIGDIWNASGTVILDPITPD